MGRNRGADAVEAGSGSGRARRPCSAVADIRDGRSRDGAGATLSAAPVPGPLGERPIVGRLPTKAAPQNLEIRQYF